MRVPATTSTPWVRASRASPRSCCTSEGRSLGRSCQSDAAHRHVHQLQAATDAEHRQAALARGGEEGELEPVAGRVHRAELRRRVHAVPHRVDVLAAGEQHGVDALERVRRVLGRDGGRQDDRHRAGGRDRVDVDGIDPGAAGALPVPAHAADRDARHPHRASESGNRGQLGSSMRCMSTSMPISGSVASPMETMPRRGAPSTGSPS